MSQWITGVFFMLISNFECFLNRNICDLQTHTALNPTCLRLDLLTQLNPWPELAAAVYRCRPPCTPAPCDPEASPELCLHQQIKWHGHSSSFLSSKMWWGRGTAVIWLCTTRDFSGDVPLAATWQMTTCCGSSGSVSEADSWWCFDSSLCWTGSVFTTGSSCLVGLCAGLGKNHLIGF